MLVDFGHTEVQKWYYSSFWSNILTYYTFNESQKR